MGFSEPTVSRILRGERGVDPTSKQGQLSLMWARIFCSLDALVGGDEARRRTRMRSNSIALQGVPDSLALTPEGLARTLAHLDGAKAPF